MSKLLDISALAKTYSNGKEKVYALKNVNLTLSSHDYVAIVGPSGAGKSTLLHTMGGLEPPDEGAVLCKGEDIYSFNDAALSLWRNRTVGFVFQFYHLIEELNVTENVALAGFVAQRDCRKSSLKKAQALLQYLGIAARGNFFPSQLSGGERQKVAIARALINEPELLLCDEPTGNLDNESQERVVALLEQLYHEKKKTIVVVTHNLELAKRAQRVFTIRNGEILTGHKDR
ncbi:MAG: ABC transporter ATP-binding protein [Candidatus Omnitrophota bacterium]